jgi:hypothetical protein
MSEEDVSREKLERRVIEDLIVRDNRYKTRVEEMAEAVIGAKRMVLSDEEPEKIADFIALKLVKVTLNFFRLAISILSITGGDIYDK